MQQQPQIKTQNHQSGIIQPIPLQKKKKEMTSCFKWFLIVLGALFAAETVLSIVTAKTAEAFPATEIEVALETNFPREMAKRAVTVAMTNCQATDVFYPDGDTLDLSKFHAYSDTSGFFLTVEEEGTWTAVNENTWHVKDMIFRIYQGSYMKVSGNVKKEGDNYIFFNVDQIIASEKYINSTDPKKINEAYYEPSEDTPYLTVPFYLISADRNIDAANNRMTAEEDRQEWIERQFSWDGRHIPLCNQIKQNLNDENSFEHIESNYIDIYDTEKQTYVNDILAKYGFSERVNVGDLFVMETFTAKNGFNATIKSVGYGIIRESNDGLLPYEVILLGIE